MLVEQSYELTHQFSNGIHLKAEERKKSELSTATGNLFFSF